MSGWNSFVYGLGDFFEWTFGLLTILGNGFNYLLMIIMTILFFYWMGQMMKHRRAGEQ